MNDKSGFGAPYTQFVRLQAPLWLLSCSSTQNWTHNSCIFQLSAVCIRSKRDDAPSSFPQWMDRGVYVLQDFYDDNGLRAFNDLQAEYSLPGK